MLHKRFTPAQVRVVLVVEHAVGGMRSHVLDLSNALIEHGYQVDLIISKKFSLDGFAPLSRQNTAQNLDSYSSLLRVWRAKSRTAMIKLISERVQDSGVTQNDEETKIHKEFIDSRRVLVHAHGMRAANLAINALKSVRGSLGKSVDLVVTLHNTWRQFGGNRRAQIRQVAAYYAFRRAVRNAKRVIAVSRDIVAESHRWNMAVELAAIPPSQAVRKLAEKSDLQKAGRQLIREFHPAVDSAGTSFVVVTLGRLMPQKGLLALPEVALALDNLIRQRQDNQENNELGKIKFLVFGDGPQAAELQAKIETLNLQNTVFIAGNRVDAIKFLAGADLALSLAKWEGQPVWLQEAMALGVPILALRGGGTEDTVGAEQGIFVTPHWEKTGSNKKPTQLLSKQTAQTLAREIWNLANNENLRLQWANKSAAGLRNRPDFSAVIEQILRIE